jgi:hypothetical protein
MFGIEVSFKDICYEHDKCYYTPDSDAEECNLSLEASLRARCESEISSQEINAFDILTSGVSRVTVLTTCYAKADAIALGVIGGQAVGGYHKIAQQKQKAYRDRVVAYLSSTQSSGFGPDIAGTIPPGTPITIRDDVPPTLQERLKSIPPGGTLLLSAREYRETLRINQWIRIESYGGTARIGVR